MNKPLGSHVDELLLYGMEKAYEELESTLKEWHALEEQQKLLKEKLQHALKTIDEIVELKVAKGQSKLEFSFDGRVWSTYDLTNYEERKQGIQTIINS